MIAGIYTKLFLISSYPHRLFQKIKINFLEISIFEAKKISESAG